jgi:hypothetical protein
MPDPNINASGLPLNLLKCQRVKPESEGTTVAPHGVECRWRNTSNLRALKVPNRMRDEGGETVRRYFVRSFEAVSAASN